MYAASTAKFVDYSDAQYRFRPPYLDNATLTPIAGGWGIALHWRIDNPSRLPLRIAIFQFEIVIDNRSDAMLYGDLYGITCRRNHRLACPIDAGCEFPIERMSIRVEKASLRP